MTFEQAVKARKYVRQYGKKWTKEQVMNFFIEVTRFAADAKGDVSDSDTKDAK